MATERTSSMLMRTLCLVTMASAIAVAPAVALAQDQYNPELLRKELADTLAQLKAAQDRKNELATENEKLKAQVAAMQKELDERRAAAAVFAEQTYSLRSRQEAWRVFLDRYPPLKVQWELFLEAPPLTVSNSLPAWQNPFPNGTTQPTASSTAPASPSTLPDPSTTTPTPPLPPTSAESPTTLPTTGANGDGGGARSHAKVGG
jgi:hypothetical protein